MAQLRLGARVRRLRQDQKLTQVQMAERLGISPSYLNLIEHNQRGLSVTLLLRLAERFGVDLAGFRAEDEGRALTDLMEVFSDPLFDGHELKTADLQEAIQASPAVARAILTLYQAWRGGRGTTTAASASDSDDAVPVGMPWEEVADFHQSRDGHFAQIEQAAQALWKDANLTPGRLAQGLEGYLGSRLAVDVAIVPDEALSGALRRFDQNTRRLMLSELLSPASRTFQMAVQIGWLTQRTLIERLAAGSKLTTGDADALARRLLVNAFAGAVMLPYDAFAEAARALRHDLVALQRRFGASFEQVAHRLATLRRPGQPGVPFFFLKVDAAGAVLKRLTLPGFTPPRFGQLCPRLPVADALARPGRIVTTPVRLPDGTGFILLARTVESAAAARRGAARALVPAVVVIGCGASHASEIAHCDGIGADQTVAAGISCRLCPRADCADRALPMQFGETSAALADEHRSGPGPWWTPAA
ncbi:MAG: XRE family transcriptional regulator [Alphaproteobacteria bacterium]|nr:short-chain fatty acyl-CoA regulator family protein [Alphaproteobacteria bacterium]TAD88801.1 MAG: XRE family transcriptional regulator [Alphaproteobacteria bacterium]